MNSGEPASAVPHATHTLLIGFDSAWTCHRRGAIVGIVREPDGALLELGVPRPANFDEAAAVVADWRSSEPAAMTVIMLDQPTIVKNATGQRMVERIVSSPVGRRKGGMQPVSTGRTDMFGRDASLWPFLDRYGVGTVAGPLAESQVFETYPALVMIALGWLLPDRRPAGRLPKYNPTNRKTFALNDWRQVCLWLAQEMAARGLRGLAAWLRLMETSQSPRKTDQDGLDACICLLVALWFVERRDCLMIGESDTGFLVAPHEPGLHCELLQRCADVNADPVRWVKTFRLNGTQTVIIP